MVSYEASKTYLIFPPDSHGCRLKATLAAIVFVDLLAIEQTNQTGDKHAIIDDVAEGKKHFAAVL